MIADVVASMAAGPPVGRERAIVLAQEQSRMKTANGRSRAVGRALRLRCPACGVGPLFRGLFRMAPECGQCGSSFRREPGFYLGSISINYGITAMGTIGLYAALVLGLGTSHELALAVSLVVAVLLPIVLFRWARAFLLALDNPVNSNQSPGGLAGGDGSDAEGTSAAAGLSERHLRRLQGDDGNAGCLMGVVLALILLFGLAMGGITLYFVTGQGRGGAGDWDAAGAG